MGYSSGTALSRGAALVALAAVVVDQCRGQSVGGTSRRTQCRQHGVRGMAARFRAADRILEAGEIWKRGFASSA